MTNKLGRNILIIFLLSLSFGKLTHSDIYDDRVVAREADKQLQNYDSMKMQNAYDKYNQTSSANNSNFTNAEVIGGAIIFLIFWLPLAYLVFVKPKKEKQKKLLQIEKERLAEEALLNKAKILGWDEVQETRECSKCYEIIKLKSIKCKHCNTEYTTNDVRIYLNKSAQNFIETLEK